MQHRIKDDYVAAHTFRVVIPAQTMQSGIPNPCTSCHKDKSLAWANGELREWTTSPWRVSQ